MSVQTPQPAPAGITRQPLVDEGGEVVGEIEVLPDPTGPPGNQGVVRCVVCHSLGWYMDSNERGHRIVHAAHPMVAGFNGVLRPWACRAAL